MPKRRPGSEGAPHVEHFRNGRDPAKLSLDDLLEAREAYRTHLANLPNVTGTALGRYRIRLRDPDRSRDTHWTKFQNAPPRTLGNSVVRSWSWPAVLVFVERWATRDEQSKKVEEMVPPWLYLSDGRRIPSCVILAPRVERPSYSPTRLTFPTGLYGGGYPILTVEQNTQRIGTLCCLVTDGHDVFGLTNRHVVGPPGTPLYTVERGELQRLGTAVDPGARRVPLEKLYPGWTGSRVSVNVDAGLFRVDDLTSWTSQVYGVGRLGEPIELGVDTLGLDVIGAPVRAFGGISGELRGEIHGLFYRYQTVGGEDHLADLLIGPRPGEALVDTHMGDSGALWVYDDPKHPPALRPPAGGDDVGPRAPEYRPLAMQWGGRSLGVPGSEDTRFALATLLSNVCRLLDVELVRDWSIEHSQYWGKVGHYKIAWSACSLPSSSYPKLRAFLAANADRISVSDADVSDGKLPKATQRDSFIALADVPDLVWRTTRKRDQANHFADMDEKAEHAPYKGKTLLQLWSQQPASRTPQAWEAFYDSLAEPPKVQHRGALPFRVKQLFEEMVEHLQNDAFDKFLCVAGVLAHYVGDACQPLHVSRLHHGEHADEKDVHSVYETNMLDRHAAEFVTRLNAKLSGRKAKGKLPDGDAAADLVVDLMRQTTRKLPPERVLEAFRDTRGPGQLAALWQQLGTPTVAVTAEGALALAKLWQSAWAAAGAESRISKTAAATAISKNRLRGLYNNPKIAEARWLRDM